MFWETMPASMAGFRRIRYKNETYGGIRRAHVPIVYGNHGVGLVVIEVGGLFSAYINFNVLAVHGGRGCTFAGFLTVDAIGRPEQV